MLQLNHLQVNMWETLISQINATLTELTGSGNPLAYVYSYPNPKLEGYPAALFFPSNFSNAYDSNQENAKEYQFSIFLLLETKVAGLETSYNTIMPALLDQVIAKIDEDWNGGQTTIGNHRIWWTLGSGAWGLVEAEKQEYLQAELTLTVKFNSNI